MKVSDDIAVNLEYMKKRLSYGLSVDVILKKFTVNAGIGRRYNAFLIYFEGTTSGTQIDQFIIESLHLIPRSAITENLSDLIEKQLISRNQLDRSDDFDNIIKGVNYGGCAVFVDTVACAFVADVKGWDDRGLDQPIAEAAVRGPQLAFNEVIRTNTGLIRKIVRNENLICESIDIGKTAVTSCNLMYIDGVANERLISEVRRRIKNITVDYLFDSGELEQLIEDFSILPTPQMLSTERPDRAAAALSAGKVAVLVDGSPFALVMPINFFELTHTSEDSYLRYPFANLIRIMRIPAMLASLLLPGIFIAVMNFHHDSIPLHLLFAIEASREKIPFSMLTELIILEFAFEFIREASVRMPGVGGSAIGIIGGLIVGQAAVDANLVSPIIIIVVSLTGIGSFVVPNYSLGLSFRIVKYFYIVLGAAGGFAGLSLGIFLQLIWLCSSQSFGIPFFAPLAPHYDNDSDGTFFVKPIWKRNKRAKILAAKKQGTGMSRYWARGTNTTKYFPDDTIDIE